MLTEYYTVDAEYCTMYEDDRIQCMRMIDLASRRILCIRRPEYWYRRKTNCCAQGGENTGRGGVRT
jgi:hypothetical protein